MGLMLVIREVIMSFDVRDCTKGLIGKKERRLLKRFVALLGERRRLGDERGRGGRNGG
jgi:hypothetical protein